ncbi:helix-turn-helix domain-containing protein [Streptomyces zingiberis]|uniref:DUF2690 domain-containing protein n=1 Tax=Streptomyces zingiberis TaxID=2053010 RepID=A0ABX1BSG0_9ACTN|nr:XRE family transcriptional regulator [Streptomyces zingiberis]NJQ00675.1 DUF2690 domain-containing protein [Streptomyces zingiberis]
MPRWKVLPEELDPPIRELAGQLRRIVELSGLGVAAVADRTGYSKTSWDRYLNGRLLPPLEAVVELAEVTGYARAPLTELWERAEEAWSRGGPGEGFGADGKEPQPCPTADIGNTTAPDGARQAGPSGPSGSSAPRPAPGTPPVVTRSVPAAPGPGPAAHSGPAVASGAPAYSGDTLALGTRGGREPASGAASATASGSRPASPPASGGSPGDGTPGGGRHGHAAPAFPPGSRGRRALLTGGALAACLVLATGAFVMLGAGGDGSAGGKAAVTTSPPASPRPELPEGVKCLGDSCTGEDPEEQGCGGENARTVTEARVGTAFVEMRHSGICQVVWARITEAAPGDTVRVSAGERSESSEVAAQEDTQPAATEAFTRMVGVEKLADAQVCATTAAGQKGCARPDPSATGSPEAGETAPPGDGTAGDGAVGDGAVGDGAGGGA